jgi:hypothetical protein
VSICHGRTKYEHRTVLRIDLAQLFREVPLPVGCSFMDEGRKRVLLIAASILAARKLAQYDGGKRVPATVSAISDSIRWAEQIMDEIDRRWSLR